jgi:hypothetical protein
MFSLDWEKPCPHRSNCRQNPARAQPITNVRRLSRFYYCVCVRSINLIAGSVRNYSQQAELLILSTLLSTVLILRSQEPTGAIIWSIVGLCSGLYLFFNGFRLLRRKHLILDTPVSKIRSASMGMVELSGLATGPYTIVAPVTERPCYYFRTVVWEWKRRGRSNKWVKVAAECTHVPFFLDDNTGKVLVDPRGAELDLHRDFQQEFCDSFFTTKEEVPPNVRVFLSRHGVNTTNKIKVEEFCIKPKNSLFLLGTLGDNPGIALSPEPIRDEEQNTLTFNAAMWVNPVRSGVGNVLSLVTGGGVRPEEEKSVSEGLFGGSFHESEMDRSGLAGSELGKSILEEEYRHAAAARVIQLSPETSSTKTSDMTQQQRIAAALTKAGISNPAAWSAAGLAQPYAGVHAGTNSSTYVAADSSAGDFESNPRIVLKKGTNNPTFLISWRSQREVASSLGWKCALMIWGGPALTLLSLYILLTITHVL